MGNSYYLMRRPIKGEKYECDTDQGMYRILKDFRNDCFTTHFPNGEITDTGCFDSALDEIKYDLKENYSDTTQVKLTWEEECKKI